MKGSRVGSPGCVTSGRRWHRRIPDFLAGRSRSGAVFEFCTRQENTMTKGSRLSVALLSALLITGCAARGVKIADLQDRPDRYDDKTVAVNGVVTTSWGIPLVPFQLYKVDDGTGEITVLARSGRAPRKGARVEVKGRLNEIGSFGGQAVGLHIEERDRKTKG
jgi:hypothetical protein